MQRRIRAAQRRSIWIEWIVWNMVAGAALGLMIAVLLCSLAWLDEVVPTPAAEIARAGGGGDPAPVRNPPARVAAVNRPSG